MSKKSDGTSFWIGYGDLMTSLFFVVLILFVVSFSHIKDVTRELTETTATLDETTATKKQLERILQLDEQFRGLEESSELQYEEDKKVFIAKDFIGVEIFNANSSTIKSEYLDTVDHVGKSLQKVLQKLHQSNPELSFLLLIEGNAAIPWHYLKRGTYNPDNMEMYRLSYERALALYMYWHSCGIDLRRYNTEIIISGSGFNGINRDRQVEENNKRFIIQIIPKISKPQIK